jgi:hypothetical protein
VRNGELERRVSELETLLAATLATEAETGFQSFKRTVELPPFDPGADGQLTGPRLLVHPL